MRRFAILFLLLAAIKSFSQNSCPENRYSQLAPFDSAEIRTELSVSFGFAYNPFSGTNEELLLDLRYPLPAYDTVSKRPLILLVHGGAFRSGTRKDFDHLSFQLARRGYITAAMDYRLGWNCSSDDPCTDCAGDTSHLKEATYMAVQDIRSALAFCTAQAAQLGIDTGNVFLCGISAGSIACYASSAWSQQLADDFIPVASALLGPLNPAACSVRGIADWCGAFPGDTSALAALNVPVISVHDEYDCVVPYASGTLLGCNCSRFYSCSGPDLIHHSLHEKQICSLDYVIQNSADHCSGNEESKMLLMCSFFRSILCSACGEENRETLSASVKPNPGDEYIVIDFSEYAHHGGTIHCLDAAGREVYRQVYHEYDAQVILPAYSFASGIYFLIFECRENLPPMKMLVSHP